MTQNLHDDFALTLADQSPIRGLARRLIDNTLRPLERQNLTFTETIAKLEDEGQKYPSIARELGWTTQKLRRWVQTDQYRVLRKFVQERSVIKSDHDALVRRQESRRRFDSNDTRALDYFDQAFKRFPKDVKNAQGVIQHRRGEYVDLDRAERAAIVVAKAMGWTEPVATTAKPKALPIGVIQGQMQGMAAADRRETVVRVTVGDTTVEVGTRQEEASLA